MLQYLIILLDKESVSFCSTPPKGERGGGLMPLETLRQGIRFGMMENLMIQYVYPDKELSKEYAEVIESIDHSKIKSLPQSLLKEGRMDADVWVTESIKDIKAEVPVVWRTDKQNLFNSEADIVCALENVPRLNVVLTDVETFTDEDFEKYKQLLSALAKHIEKLYVEGKAPQLNLLTDRMMLQKMNNCGAGDTTITLAPNGKFYVCPAFFYEDESDSIGDLENGLDIKNKQLYKLEYAPICRHCDAYQCKRCIWLNRKTTLEVNTPSHEQCVLAHLERNASRELLNNIRKHGTFLPEQEDIKEIDYLDPFDKRDTWQ
ncbi:MAG: CXXX repeat peptide maturase [Bacteroidaceae bacterium]|nr:CXXX repeat peptide maturase [Bacteroidaceae bacterium]